MSIYPILAWFNGSWPGLTVQFTAFFFIIIKKRIQKNELLTIKGGTKVEGRGGRKNVLKRTRGQLKRMYYSTQSI